MTDDEARRLATRIIDTWPTAAKAYVWRDLLAPLDIELAREAYRRLEREIERGAPTPGHFHATYRAVHRALHPPSTEQPELDDPVLSRHEYLARLAAKAETDPAAARELRSWRRLIAEMGQ
jgi:hypothetical protein